MSAYNAAYRIVIQPSIWQKRMMLAFYGGVMLSVVFASPLFSYFWLLQLALIGVVAYFAWQNYQQASAIIHLNLYDSGKVELEQNQQWLPFKLQVFSLVSDWFCLLRLISDSPLDGATKRSIWLWRDSVDEDNYRRVCRVITRVRSGQCDE